MQRVVECFDRLTGPSRWWAPKVGLIAICLSAMHATPAYEIALHHRNSFNVAKGQHPFTHFTPVVPGSHEGKLDFRFVVPLLLRPFRGSPVAAMVIFAICGVIVFGVLAAQLLRVGVPERTAALSVFGIAVTAAGGTFLLTLDYFDSVAIAFVALAMWAPRTAVAGVLALAALFTDERALLGLLLGVVSAAWLNDRRGLSPPILVGTAALYMAIRVALEATTGLRTDHDAVGIGLAHELIAFWPRAVLAGYAFWWPLILFGLWRGLRRAHGLSVAGLSLITVGAAVAVADVTRSLAYLVFVVPVVVVAIRERCPERTDLLILGSGIGCFAIPAFTMAGHSIGHELPIVLHLRHWF